MPGQPRRAGPGGGGAGPADEGQAEERAGGASAAGLHAAARPPPLLSLPPDVMAKVLAAALGDPASPFALPSLAARDVAGLAGACRRLRGEVWRAFNGWCASVPAPAGGFVPSGEGEAAEAAEAEAPPPHSPISSDAWARVQRDARTRVPASRANSDYRCESACALAGRPAADAAAAAAHIA